ncbi:MAG: hypothetical protein PHI23_03920 [Candidatus Peribacteraceae bacterium]|nr:hypothetical protein [Candidatus Peribacteraceae bacterium]
MQKTCRNPWCQQPFEVTQKDLDLIEEISPSFNGKKESIPPPTLCPDCRQQRRLSLRNARHLYRNTCGLTGAPLITNVSPDKPFPVYAREAWLGDGWDAATYALERKDESFFAQMGELFRRVPRWGNYIENCENCDFCINSYGGKDSYLVVSAGDFERCLYAQRVFKSYECTDCTNLLQAELCHECLDSEDLHSCTFLQNCKQCQRCDFCLDCASCQDCLLCAGLRRKRYCVRNKQVTREEYEKIRAELLRNPTTLHTELARIALTVPHRANHIIACEGSTGDYLTHDKGVLRSFFVSNSEDAAEIYDSDHVTLSYSNSDADYYTECYEVGSAAWINHSAFCDNSIYLTDCYCCSTCSNCEHCFGCIGLKRKQYCILNKQYPREEYERLVPQIIEQMRKAGEWGEFFPVAISPFTYNESVAQEYFPLTREEVEEHGWKWKEEKDEMPKVSKVIPAQKLPDSIEEVPDDILNWAIECEATKRPFKIIRQELDFYRKMRLPIPHFHPDERHRRRMALRNPRKLWKRSCAKCGKEIETTYAPERPEIVYCENCYLKEVY